MRDEGDSSSARTKDDGLMPAFHRSSSFLPASKRDETACWRSLNRVSIQRIDASSRRRIDGGEDRSRREEWKLRRRGEANEHPACSPCAKTTEKDNGGRKRIKCESDLRNFKAKTRIKSPAPRRAVFFLYFPVLFLARTRLDTESASAPGPLEKKQ